MNKQEMNNLYTAIENMISRSNHDMYVLKRNCNSYYPDCDKFSPRINKLIESQEDLLMQIAKEKEKL